MIDPHGDVGDVISDVPSLSVDEVEKRFGDRGRARVEGFRSGAPPRGGTAPAPNRRVTLWRDSATILIFVLIAVLAARFMLNGSGTATASPTLEPTGVAVTESPGDSGFLFSFTPSFGPPVDPSSGLNASPTPIPVITLPPLAPPTAPSNASATRGNQAVDVTWNAPTSNGGSFITTHPATSTPGGKTCSAKRGTPLLTLVRLTTDVACPL